MACADVAMGRQATTWLLSPCGGENQSADCPAGGNAAPQKLLNIRTRKFLFPHFLRFFQKIMELFAEPKAGG
jgi:hypothetical protein